MKNNSFNNLHRWFNAIANFNESDVAGQIIAVEMLDEEDNGKRMQTVKRHEYSKIRRGIIEQDDRDFTDSLLETGVRCGSAALLPKDRVFLETERIEIPWFINKGKIHSYEVNIDARIFDTFARRVTDDKLAYKAFLRLPKMIQYRIQESGVDIDALIRRANEFVFPMAVFYGPTRYVAHVRYVFRKSCDANGIVDRRLHDLRRSFATERFRDTGDLAAVSKALGHRSIVTTERYLGLDESDIRDLFEPVVHSYSREQLEFIQYC